MIDTDHPELVEFEGETLGDTLTNLLAEVKRLQMDNTLLENNLKQSKRAFNRVCERCSDTKEELLVEVKRLRKKLFEAELWVVNDSYTFENCMKELNDYAERYE